MNRLAGKRFFVKISLGYFKRFLFFFKLPNLFAGLHPEFPLLLLLFQLLHVDDLYLELDSADFDHVVLPKLVVLLYASVDHRSSNQIHRLMHLGRRQRLLALVFVAGVNVTISDLLLLRGCRLCPLDQGRWLQHVTVFNLFDVSE